MDNRIIAGKIETLQNAIDSRRDKAARIRARLCDPVSAGAFDEPKAHGRDPRKRERLLTDGIDRANELEREADELQMKLDALREELRQQIAKEDYKTRTIIKQRLLWACSWEEVAELSGYSVRHCQDVFSCWLNT